MLNYQLEIKQLVNYPRCRIYRGFVRQLTHDRSLRSNRRSYLYGLYRPLLIRQLSFFLPPHRGHHLFACPQRVDLPLFRNDIMAACQEAL